MTITDSADLIAGFNGTLFISGCQIDKGTPLTSPDDGTLAGFRVEPGGSITAGSVLLRNGAVIRALPEGGFVIEADAADPS